jgi:ethanolamine utilization protein EutS
LPYEKKPLILIFNGGDVTEAEKPRSIQEYVPGKQVTMAHLIARPQEDLCKQIGVDNRGAIGIMTITPGEGTIIAADAAGKSGDIKLEFVDRFTGCLVFSGNVAAVESALRGAVEALEHILQFTPTRITKS